MMPSVSWVTRTKMISSFIRMTQCIKMPNTVILLKMRLPRIRADSPSSPINPFHQEMRMLSEASSMRNTWSIARELAWKSPTSAGL